MGGEKLTLIFLVFFAVGSPPHGRGKVGVLGLNCGNVGITPAWAGKSYRVYTRLCGRGDHPRVGGEKCSWMTQRKGT